MLESCDKNLKCLSLNSKTSASNTVCTKNHDTVAFDLKSISKNYKSYYANRAENLLTQLLHSPSKWKCNSIVENCNHIGLKRAFKLSQKIKKFLDFWLSDLPISSKLQ